MHSLTLLSRSGKVTFMITSCYTLPSFRSAFWVSSITTNHQSILWRGAPFLASAWGGRFLCINLAFPFSSMLPHKKLKLLCQLAFLVGTTFNIEINKQYCCKTTPRVSSFTLLDNPMNPSIVLYQIQKSDDKYTYVWDKKDTNLFPLKSR